MAKPVVTLPHFCCLPTTIAGTGTFHLTANDERKSRITPFTDKWG